MRIAILGMLFAFTTTLVAPVQARPLEDIEKSGKLIIGTDGTFPPFQYFEDGKLVGFEVDLGNEIAKRMHLTPEWKPIAFDTLLAGLTQDRWDIVIAALGATPERAKVVNFTDPNFCTGAVIVATQPTIKHKNDLSGKTVSVQTGSTYFAAVEKIPGIKKIRNMSSDNDARNAMLSGRSDAWVSDKFVARIAQQKTEDRDKKLLIGDMLFEEKSSTAVNKNNPALLEKYNRALAELRDDGTYDAISKKWFGEDISCSAPSPDTQPLQTVK
ncbi:ABC transporter substrate-binding protein [Pseudomonas helleri]|uniref:ABC transporter substrate-binding protein n=1 Tax=Pseudomonas helleri TaxID=1608996 RepID=UPI0028E76F0F|nr:ABC transporter substrate-binding protein [Pseudomonas helleri]